MGQYRPGMLYGGLVLLTVLWFFLGIETPVYLQADAAADDFLMVRYAETLLRGEWLGSFDSMTLVKTAGYPALLAAGAVLHVPYVVGLRLAYFLAVVAACLALRSFLDYRWCAFLYVFLLFSPAMICEETVQRVYRGGYIVSFSLLVLACVVGMFIASCRSWRETLAWSILCSAALPIFWFLKEDSIWILPLVLIAALLAAVRLWQRARRHRILCVLIPFLPLCILFAIQQVYELQNLQHYGEKIVVDRSGAQFSRLITDLFRLDQTNAAPSVWLTHQALSQAMEVSPTLAEMRTPVERIYGQELPAYVPDSRLRDPYLHGEIPGDFAIWKLRDAASEIGIYARGGAAAEAWYARAAEEIESALRQGELRKGTGRLYLSSICRGYSREEMQAYVFSRTGDVLINMATYRYAGLIARPATGTEQEIARMERLVKSPALSASPSEEELQRAERHIRYWSWIVTLYQWCGLPLAIAGMAGSALLLWNIMMKCKASSRVLREQAVVLLGLGGSIAGLVVGVQWFASFLPERSIYYYLYAAYPMMQICECLGLVVLSRRISAEWYGEKRILGRNI